MGDDLEEMDGLKDCISYKRRNRWMDSGLDRQLIQKDG